MLIVIAPARVGVSLLLGNALPLWFWCSYVDCQCVTLCALLACLKVSGRPTSSFPQRAISTSSWSVVLVSSADTTVAGLDAPTDETFTFEVDLLPRNSMRK